MAEILVIRKKEFIVEEREYSMDDLFDRNFYSWSDSRSELYRWGQCFDNLIYLNIVLNILAIEYFMQRHNIKKVTAISAHRETLCYVCDAADKLGIPVEIEGNRPYQYSKQEAKAIIFAETLYFLFRTMAIPKQHRELDLKKDLCVIRTKAARKKILPAEDREIFYEEKIADGSFYRFFGRRFRIRKLWRAFIEARVLVDSLQEHMNRAGFVYSSAVALNFMKFRFLPLTFYRLMLDKLMSFPWQGKFISGNNLDMYALAEEEIAHKYKRKTVCIPHGLEYGFKFPHCFTGDTFYTTSDSTAKYLNQLYNETKFVFNPEIAREMFFMGTASVSTGLKTVYFSEPREPEVNIEILTGLLEELKGTQIELYIKHHPGDDMADYKAFDGKIKVIDDLKEAVAGNICIARKSTTLLEGIYNAGTCAAIIVNEKDYAVFHTFPSLQTNEIRKFYNVKDLAEWIIMRNQEVQGGERINQHCNTGI